MVTQMGGSAFEHQLPATRSATAVKKNANARSAAKVRTVFNRSHRSTIALQLPGGASGRHSIARSLIGTVPKSVTKIQMSHASTPAHRKTKPVPVASVIATAIPDTNAGRNM